MPCTGGRTTLTVLRLFALFCWFAALWALFGGMAEKCQKSREPKDPLGKPTKCMGIQRSNLGGLPCLRRIGTGNCQLLPQARAANHGGKTSGLPSRVAMHRTKVAARTLFLPTRSSPDEDPCRRLAAPRDAGCRVGRTVTRLHPACANGSGFWRWRRGCTWVAKPCTIDMAAGPGAVRAGAGQYGSAAKLQKVLHAGTGGETVVGRQGFPGELDSPYGGLYFYGGHTAEILTTVFGPAAQYKGRCDSRQVPAVFKYAELAVCVNFGGHGSTEHCTARRRSWSAPSISPASTGRRSRRLCRGFCRGSPRNRFRPCCTRSVS